MFKKILKILLPLSRKNTEVFALPAYKFMDLHDVQKAYARTFSTNDGQLVLEHLQRVTFMKAYPADVDSGQIRYTEGQRALVGQILRHITAGRTAP